MIDNICETTFDFVFNNRIIIMKRIDAFEQFETIGVFI